MHLLKKNGNKKDAQTGRTTKPYTRKHFSGMQFKINSVSPCVLVIQDVRYYTQSRSRKLRESLHLFTY